jgi:hypothetical protein
VTKKIKQVKKPSQPLRTSQGTWARYVVKAHAFAEHLANVFQPYLRKLTQRETSAYTTSGDTYQLEPPINCLKRAEV